MVNNQIVTQVIALFKKHETFRDERYETIEYIINKHYKEFYGKSIFTDFKLLTDIDRAFRLVQAEIVELRGKKWLDRQRQGGEISQEDYENQKMQSDIRDAAQQLDLFTDTDNE